MRTFIARKEDKAVNGLALVLAGILFVAPWLFGFADRQTASWNAWISAALIAAATAFAFAQLSVWEEWADALVGLWIAISPWLLGFADMANAMWSHVVIGLGVAALALYELWQLSDDTRARIV